jgi:hypothetical protein
VILSVWTLLVEYNAHKDRQALWGMCVYGFVSEVLCVDITAAISVFYTAPDACVVNGPQFDLVFYTTTAALVAGIAGTAVSIYKARYMKGWNTRLLMQVATMIRMFGALTDIAIAKGWYRHIGVSAKSGYLFGDAVVTPVGIMIATIGLASFSSKTVYRHRETVTYSIVTSWQNLGVSVSRIVGLVLMELFHVRGDLNLGCNYDNYVPLLVLCKLVLPAFNFGLAYMLIANA